MDEADRRTTWGVADGETRTYHGITGDLVNPEEIGECKKIIVRIHADSKPYLSIGVA